MDSVTHVCFGIGLAALAHWDPTLATSPAAFQSIAIATVAGSVIPDCDTIFRLGGNANFLRQHRGITHSLPFLLVWAFGIAGAVSLIPNAANFIILFIWTSIALILHVLTDVLNPYGTQVFIPFSKKRYAWNVLPTFDPFIFTIHLIGIIGWVQSIAPVHVIASISYVMIGVYIGWRFLKQRNVIRNLPHIDKNYARADHYWALPTANPFRFEIGKRTSKHTFHTGTLSYHNITWLHQWVSDKHPAILNSTTHDTVKALIEFSNDQVVHVYDHDWGTEVRWFDVRYTYRKNFPLVASVMMDRNLQPISGNVGWMNERQLHKKHNRTHLLRIKKQKQDHSIR